MKKILVSSCLYGGSPVRYDAADIPSMDEDFLKAKEEGRLIPVCPEISGGLGVPRSPVELSGGSAINHEGSDVTAEFLKGAEESIRVARENNVACVILKDGSPSCGSNNIYDGTFTGKKIPGQGITAEALRDAGFPVFSENEIDKALALICKQ